MRFSISVLLLALILAVGLHVGAFYALYDAHWEIFPTHTKALWENQHATVQEKELAVAEEREEAKRRNQELAQIFKSIQRPSDEIQNALSTDRTVPYTESYTTSVSEIQPQVSLAEPKLVADLLKQAVDPLNVNQGDVEKVFSDREGHVDELLKTQELARGVIDVSVTESLVQQSALKVGYDERGALLGAFADEKAGFHDTGIVDPLLRTSGAFLFSRAVQNGSGAAGGGPHFPGIQQDPLRGFNASTLATLASSNDFTLTVQVAKRANAPGYVFKLELNPKPGVQFKRIAQNYFFLIDRSQSIRPQRYEMTKQAVSKALGYLNPEDTFNVLLFDDKVMAFAQANVSSSQENIARARLFLEKNHYGAFFASTDLYTSLDRIIPDAVAESEVNTAILLSDGDTYLKPEKQRETIVNWTKKNGGKVTLYSVAAGKGNNESLLDLLSVFNRGFLRYAQTEKGLDSTLLGLMHSIRHPIGKEITVLAIEPTKTAKIVLYPPNSFLPNLHQNNPYVIYGTIDKLIDFHIFYQGKYYDKYLDIKQNVSFANALPGDVNSLERKLGLYRAYKNYESYLRDGDPAHLQQAKQVLQAHQLPVVFQ